MSYFLRCAAGLLVTGLLLNAAPEAAAQTTGPGKGKPATGKTTARPATRKKKTPAKPTAHQPAAPAATPAAAGAEPVYTPEQQEVLAAREAATAGMKEAMAQGGKMVEIEGMAMLPTRSVFENLRLLMDHTLFVKAIQQAGLEEKLRKDDILVFAPTNQALLSDPTTAKIWEAGGTKELVAPYLVSGRLNLAELKSRDPLTTLSGDQISVYNKKDRIGMREPLGNTFQIAKPNVESANGFFNIIDQPIRSKVHSRPAGK